MSDSNTIDRDRDAALAQAVSERLAALQLAIREAVEAGLKVEVMVEQMHPVGEHYPQPLLEASVERIEKLI
jgi:hypothetical protein